MKMSRVEYTIIIASVIIWIIIDIIFRKSGKRAKINIERSAFIYYIVFGTYCFCKDNYIGFAAAAGAFIGSLIRMNYADLYACENCGRQYGISILFKNRCPHCKTRI